MSFFKKLFGNLPKQEKNDENDSDSEIEIAQYEIDIIALERIPRIETDYLTIKTFDLSVTQLRIPPVEKTITKPNGQKDIQQRPEIIFNLKTRGRNTETTEYESISLGQAILDRVHFHVLASRAIEINEQHITFEAPDGIRLFKRLVYDLIVLPKMELIKSNSDYEDYQRDLDRINKNHRKELEEAQENYRKRLSIAEQDHAEREKTLRKNIDNLQQELMEALIDLPQKRNALLKEALKKSYGGRY